MPKIAELQSLQTVPCKFIVKQEHILYGADFLDIKSNPVDYSIKIATWLDIGQIKIIQNYIMPGNNKSFDLIVNYGNNVIEQKLFHKGLNYMHNLDSKEKFSAEIIYLATLDWNFSTKTILEHKHA